MKMTLEDYIRTVPDYPVPGVNFYDLNSLFAGPKFLEAMNQLVTKTKYTFGDKTPTHIVGIESRGFVMGSVLAYAMKLPFIMVRKKGAKYPGELLEQSYALEYGEATLTLQTGLLGHVDRCIIVDDLIATGGSVMATKQLIEQTGATVIGATTVIDLAYVRDEQPLDLDTVSTMRVPPHEVYEGPDLP
jgi:adenine phosphoribosyltransferase